MQLTARSIRTLTGLLGVLGVLPLAGMVVWFIVEQRLSTRGPDTGAARVSTELLIRDVYAALCALAEGHYATFTSLPTNRVLQTSAELVATLPKDWGLDELRLGLMTHKEAFTSRLGITDYRGSYLNFIMNRESLDQPNAFRYHIRIWSNGRNEKNENGQGDDWSRTFTFTVGPNRPPQDEPWHPPLP